MMMSKPLKYSRITAVSAFAMSLLLTSSAVFSQDPATTAKAVLAELGKQEATRTAGKLQVRITDRGGPWKSGETASETRRRLVTGKGQEALGTMTFGPEGWLKDLNIQTTTSSTFRNRTAEIHGVLRRLLEAEVEGRQQREGRVSKISTTAPADAILSRRVAKSVEDMQWTSAKMEGNFLTLEGKRKAEQHVLVLAREPKVQVISWSLTRLLTSPSGEGYPQTYICDVRAGSTTDTVASLDELYVNAPPAAQVMTRVTEVRKEEPLTEVKPADLTIRFPAGTVVKDVRNDIPVEYVQTDEGVNEEDVAQRAAELAKGRATVGQPAPAFELKDSKGKVIRLQDYAGKVLVIAWFSAAAKNAQPVGEYLRGLSQEYAKSKGVEVLAISLEAEKEAVAETTDYVKRLKWTFPFVLDPDGESMRKYGLEAALPKIAIVDRQGKIAFVRPGIDPEAISAAIAKVL